MDLQSSEVIALLCRQRHDFLNDLQVVSGYIQLNKSERALNYLKSVYQRLEHSGRLLHLRDPELALIAIRRAEMAAARGIILELEVTTRMENLLLPTNEIIPLWTGAWDAALGLACSGATLKVSLSRQGQYYHLKFATEPQAQAPPEIASVAELARRCGVYFNYHAAKGEISLLFASSVKF